MSLLNILDIITNLDLLTKDGSKKRQNKIQFVSYIFLFFGILWLAIEMNSLQNLIFPIRFTLVFIMAGIILAPIFIILLWKLNLIDDINRKDFIILLISITAITLSAGSFINKRYGLTENIRTIVIKSRLKGSNTLVALVYLKGQDVWIRIPKSKPAYINEGDSIEVQKINGIFGFEIISNATVINKK